MRLYNRYYKSNYHELISHYPRYYREVFEMVEILKAQGKVVDALEDNIEQTFLDHFILTADPPTLRTWEKFLGITYEEQLALEQRRRVVIARLCGLGHIGEPEIRAIIGNYSDGETDVDFENSSTGTTSLRPFCAAFRPIWASFCITLSPRRRPRELCILPPPLAGG